MRVYAETNWLLDLVFQQERFAASSFVLSLAQSRKIDLCLPEFIVWEGNQKVERRIVERGTIIKQLQGESREFGRSQEAAYQTRSASLKVEADRLEDISDLERARFDQIIPEIHPIVTWLHLSDDTWIGDIDFQDRYELKQADALIYAIIRADAASHSEVEKCFIDYDRGFDNAELRQDMRNLGITLLGSAEAVTGFLQSQSLVT